MQILTWIELIKYVDYTENIDNKQALKGKKVIFLSL